MRRIVSLDAFRGAAILLMMVIHAVQLEVLGGIAAVHGGELPPVMQAPEDPLATPAPFFFFITGISLAISFHNRRKRQSRYLIARHTMARSGLLIMTGLIVSVLELVPGGLIFIANGREPVSMIGLADLVALPFILLLTSWQILVALACIVCIAVPTILTLPLVPSSIGFMTPPLLTGPFSAFKTLPLVLLGASVGKQLVSRRHKLQRWLIIAAVVAWIAFLASVLFVGEPIERSRGIYYVALPMTAGTGLSAMATFEFLEKKNVNLTPFTVLGQTALILYAAHIVIIHVFRLLIPHEPSIIWALLLSLLTIAILWPLAYLYVRWRSGTND